MEFLIDINVFTKAVSLIFGLIVGSFLNVCIYRLPREGMSIVKPPSSCPVCKKQIKAWQNVPVISYLLLGGKCAKCKTPISLRYPVVELLNGILYLFCVHKFGLEPYTFFYMAFCSALIVIIFIDVEFFIIPDVITLPFLAAGLLCSMFILVDPYDTDKLLGIGGSLIGMLTGGGLFYVIAVASRGGMGGGDIKMMAMTGAILGWKSVLMAIFIGSFVGTFCGIPLMIFKGKGGNSPSVTRKTKIPFGPFLSVGTLIVLFYGKEMLWLYLRSFK